MVSQTSDSDLRSSGPGASAHSPCNQYRKLRGRSEASQLQGWSEKNEGSDKQDVSGSKPFSGPKRKAFWRNHDGARRNHCLDKGQVPFDHERKKEKLCGGLRDRRPAGKRVQLFEGRIYQPDGRIRLADLVVRSPEAHHLYQRTWRKSTKQQPVQNLFHRHLKGGTDLWIWTTESDPACRNRSWKSPEAKTKRTARTAIQRAR